VSTGRTISKAAPTAPQPQRGRNLRQAGIPNLADVALPVSLGLWAAGIMRTRTTVLGPFGLLPDLPVVFFTGVALLVISAAAELTRRQPSRWRMALHAVTLVIMLYGTAPLLYPEARYTWVYKIIGPVQYVNAYGRLNGSIDIYQNWPGFFALAAWFTKLAGLGSPLSYVKWAQLFYELAALPLLYLIYGQLRLTPRQRFVAVMLYAACNWVGQDYFSPQAAGTLLSLGIMAMAMRWLYLARPVRLPPWHRLGILTVTGAGARTRPIPELPAPATPVVIAILLMYFVLTFTHELSPYIIAVQLGMLAAIGALRPPWLPVALGSIAAGYLLPHWSFINSHYGLLHGAGNFFGNASPPAFRMGASSSQLVIERCSAALSLGIWALAAAGAWLRRRAGQDALPLPLLAFSPAVLLAVQGYGHEGILRVYLFSLPWSAALAACALLPWQRLGSGGKASFAPGRRRAGAVSWATARRCRRAALSGGSIAMALALFFPAFFGDDSSNVMSGPEVGTVTSFLRNAPPGPIYVPVQHGPFADIARYNEFPVRGIPGLRSVASGEPGEHGIAGALAKNAVKASGRRAGEAVYVIVTPSMLAYSQAYQLLPVSSFKALLASLAHSAYWKLVRERGGTVIYQLARPRRNMRSSR
jgi:hypothetical protein